MVTFEPIWVELVVFHVVDHFVEIAFYKRTDLRKITRDI
jgi:hypothetical protein